MSSGASRARAATLLAPGQLQVRSYDAPDVQQLGGAVLRVLACGLCGTDVEQWQGHFVGSTWEPGPVIPGHEIVGVIEDADPETLTRWGVAAGEMIAVEPTMPCGTCRACLAGRYPGCIGARPGPRAFGFLPTYVPPALWGGYAEAVYVPPNAVVHRVPTGLAPAVAALYNAFANGFHWATALPSLQYGQTVAILGAGQRGLACVAAARAAGAGRIVVTGLVSDAHRLEAASLLGADAIVRVASDTDVSHAIRNALGGELADLAVDCSAGATSPVTDAVLSVREGGTVVLAGLKGGAPVGAFPSDRVVLGGLRILGARSAPWAAYEQALQYLAAHADRLQPLATHRLPLERADDALTILAGRQPSARPIYVSIDLQH